MQKALTGLIMLTVAGNAAAEAVDLLVYKV